MAAMFMIPKGMRSAITGHDDLQHQQPCATPRSIAPGACPSGVEWGHDAEHDVASFDRWCHRSVRRFAHMR